MDDASDETQYGIVLSGNPLPPDKVGLCDTDSLPLGGVDWNLMFGGRFVPLSQLGRGGFATVYRVFDRKLQREVALKILRPSLQGDTHSIQWLRREGLATASLKHPHIVTLYDFDTIQDSCFLVSELIVGKTLAEYIQDNSEGCDPRQAAEIVMYLAEALAHAHSKNVLHRDIKPANILLDHSVPTGSLTFSPRLADFGLASTPSMDSASLSASNLMGTVFYLPPEVLGGMPEGFSAQSDIYALAVVLRELLTGKRVVTGTTYSQIILQIINADFKPLQSRKSGISADLIAICLQGMQVSPDKRYASAMSFAEDLRRYLNGQPVSARLPGIWERSWRMMKRHPAMSASLSLLVIACISVVSLIRVNEARLEVMNKNLASRNESLEKALAESRAARIHNERIIYSQDMAEASDLFASGNLRGVRTILDRYSPGRSLHSHADLDYRLLSKSIQKHSPELLWTAPNALYTGCFTCDGQALYAGGAGPQITQLQIASRTVRRQWDTGQVEINCVVLSSDESVLWTTGNNGTVCAWKLEDGQLLWRAQVFDPSTEAHELVYLEKLDRLVVLGGNSQLRYLSPLDGSLLGELSEYDYQPVTLAGLADGKRFLLGDTKCRIHLVDIESNPVLTELHLSTEKNPRNHTTATRYIAVSQDGKLATVTTRNNIIYLVDLVNWSVTDSLDNIESPRLMRFLGDPNKSYDLPIHRLWLATMPGVMVEFNVSLEGKLLNSDSWASDGHRIFNLLQNPQNQDLITLDSRGDVEQWTANSSDWQIVSPNIDANVVHHSLTSSMDSLESPNRLVFFQCNHGSLDIFDITGNGMAVICDNALVAVCQTKSDEYWVIDRPTAAYVVTAQQLQRALDFAGPSGKSRKLELPWQERGLPFRADPFADKTSNYRLASSDGGKWVAGWDSEAECVWCMQPDSSDSVVWSSAKEVTLVWFEPKSQNCWWVANHRSIYRWNLAEAGGPKLVAKLDNQPVKDLAISPDKTLLAIQRDDATCLLWDLSRNQVYMELMHAEVLRDVAFSTSSRTFLALGEKGRLACWNIATGRKTLDQSYATENIYGGFTIDTRFLIRSFPDKNGWNIESLEAASYKE